MKSINITLLLFFTLYSPSLINAQNNWNLYIQNDVEEWIPARISFNNKQDLMIKNAQETITLPPFKKNGDTTIYQFIDYNSQIAFAPKGSDNLVGYWINFESSPVKRRAVKAERIINPSESLTDNATIAGKWKAIFNNNGRTYDAMLLFEKRGGDTLYGTIRTKSGDYRFLEGTLKGEHFFVSSFSGNSLFKMEGNIKGDSIVAKVSGLKTNSIIVTAQRDEDFELPDEKQITRVINNKDFNLDLKDENGVQQNFKQLTKGKVGIVSIFGTWCPNCVDETNYFNQLKQKYPQIEIINVAFEATDNEVEQQKRVKGFKERKKLKIRFLIGGKVDNDNVMSKFPMINSLGIYPTSLLIDKKGKIVEIHTGFNGPATGIIYDRFKEDYEAQIRKLLND